MTKTLFGAMFLLTVFSCLGFSQDRKPQLIDFHPCRLTTNKHCKKNELKISWNVTSVANAVGAIVTREANGKSITLVRFAQRTGSLNDSICEVTTYRVVAIDRRKHKITDATDYITIPNGEILECK